MSLTSCRGRSGGRSAASLRRPGNRAMDERARDQGAAANDCVISVDNAVAMDRLLSRVNNT